MAESQSERLFQALVRFIDHMETSERTLEWIEEQAREGNALRGLTEEETEEYLNDLRARIAVADRQITRNAGRATPRRPAATPPRRHAATPPR